MYICSFQEYFSGYPNNRLQATKFSKSPSAFADPILINYLVQIDIIITVLNKWSVFISDANAKLTQSRINKCTTRN